MPAIGFATAGRSVDEGRVVSGAPESSLQQALAALSSYYFGGKTLEDGLAAVATVALDAIGAADFVALIVSVERRPLTTFFTDDRAYDLDQLQYSVGSGPCLDAFRDGQLYSIPRMRDEVRWPEFAEAALERGVNSTLSVPLMAADVHLGAMNLYSSEERSFGDDETELAVKIAVPASVMLANAAAYSNALALGQDLAAAMESRASIEQAKGLIMGSMRCGPDEAFEILVKQSQQQNIKLRQLAEELVRNAGRGR